MEAKTIAKTTQDMMVDIQAKVVALENRQAETQNQQVSLSQMYQDLSKSRDDWSLAEIEQVLSTANQQLQLSKNIDGALVALQNADRTLAHSNKPQFIAIRGAIARDIGRLRAVPNVDTAGMALKLDSIISEISRLPLMAGEKPLPDHDRDASSRMKKELEFSLSPSDWAHSSAVLWNDWIDDMRGEIHSLVRVQEVDAPGCVDSIAFASLLSERKPEIASALGAAFPAFAFTEFFQKRYQCRAGLARPLFRYIGRFGETGQDDVEKFGIE